MEDAGDGDLVRTHDGEAGAKTAGRLSESRAIPSPGRSASRRLDVVKLLLPATELQALADRAGMLFMAHQQAVFPEIL